jgi:hypothetical protein
MCPPGRRARRRRPTPQDKRWPAEAVAEAVLTGHVAPRDSDVPFFALATSS